MDDATLLSPIVMQCEDEILEGHEQSSGLDGGLKSSSAGFVEMKGEISRNAQNLSRCNPSRIKELQHIASL
jgi:hypothetical protein